MRTLATRAAETADIMDGRSPRPTEWSGAHGAEVRQVVAREWAADLRSLVGALRAAEQAAMGLDTLAIVVHSISPEEARRHVEAIASRLQVALRAAEGL